jgi:hypothetical protein
MVTRRRWLGSLVRRRPYAAIATGACVIAAAGSALIFGPHQAGHRPRALAADCGIVTCTATIPPRASTSAAARPSPSQPTHSTVAPHVTRSPPRPPPPCPPPPRPRSRPPHRPGPRRRRCRRTWPRPSRSPTPSYSAGAAACRAGSPSSITAARPSPGGRSARCSRATGSTAPGAPARRSAATRWSWIRPTRRRFPREPPSRWTSPPRETRPARSPARSTARPAADRPGNNSNPVSCTFDGASVCQAQQQPQQDHHRERWGGGPSGRASARRPAQVGSSHD